MRMAQIFSRKGRVGMAMPDLGLFGEQMQRLFCACARGCHRAGKTRWTLCSCAHSPDLPGAQFGRGFE
ncbi:MAG: hypothetical protein CVU24_17115 [Betaproteobacteria bacterium HGW-Betaproteobacteria-18]|nr:MAG: hypothetical protein CVU24_17115 [Betaproteobacteria bacterium HGW-Betaproteobacteria-18]PKO60982.1 MAG: hypothetical protein CVU23_12895 [Betaproteobacteria bacterium HGW-Betaproteobacteria-17]